MNSYFSLKRTWQLICGQWSENRKFYMYGTLALLGLLTIVMALWIFMSNGSYIEDKLVVFYLLGLIGVCGISSNAFNIFKSKPGSVYWMMIPASAADKLVSTLFYNIVVLTIIYTLCFLLVANIAIYYIERLAQHNVDYRLDKINWETDSNDRQALKYFLYAFFAIQSFYILGSVYFKKYSFILTTIIAVLLIFGFVYYMQKISRSFGTGASFLGDELSILSQGHIRRYKIDNSISSILLFLFKFIWAPFFWLVTWYRLKEKEI